AARAGNLGRAPEVDAIEPLVDGGRVVAEPLAVALVDEEFVRADGHDLAHRRVLGLGRAADVGELVGVLAHGARARVDGDDAREARAGAAVLNERALHGADERLAVGADGQALHALVGDAAGGVAGDLVVAARRQVADGERRRQREGAYVPPGD